MSEFDEIDALKAGKDKTDKLKEYYEKSVKIELWLTNTFKNIIINFKDRTEYKKNNLYHRLNGPAIDCQDSTLSEFYYKGVKYETEVEWKKATIKELRRIKLKKLKNTDEK